MGRPPGSGGVPTSAALPLLDNGLALPASRRLASAGTALGTRPMLLLGQAPSLLSGEEMTAQRSQVGCCVIRRPACCPIGSFHPFHYAMARAFRNVALLTKLLAMTPKPNHRAVPCAAVIATAPQTVPSFDHTDPAFAPDAPALASAKPSLSFVCASCRRLPSWSGQDHASDAAPHGGVFILRRGKAAIARRDVRWAIEQGDVPIQRRGPQRHVRRTPVVDTHRR